jgi:stress response protein SCP2
MTKDGGAHTALVVGILKDVGDHYLFTPKGDYVNGDINEIAASL